jgi:hypothetical protein
MSQIGYITQSHTNSQVKELEAFLGDEKLRSVKDSPYTNISDQVRGYVYSIPFDSRTINTLPSDQILIDGDGEGNGTSLGIDSGPSEADIIADTHAANRIPNWSGSEDEDVDEGPSDDDDYGGGRPPRVVIRSLKTKIDEFLDKLEKARRTGALLNYCERQYFNVPSSSNRPYLKLDSARNIPKFDPDVLGDQDENYRDVDIPLKRSCIMLDFDFYQPGAAPQLVETHCYSLAFNVIVLMLELFDFESTENRAGKRLDTHIAFTRKPEIVPVKHPKYGDCFKDGLHMLIFVKISREAKDFLIRKIIERNLLQDIFEGMKISGSINDTLDRASSYVPVLFHGCAKSGKPPYIFYSLYEVQMVISTTTNMPRVKIVPNFEPTKNQPARVKDPNDGRKWLAKEEVVYNYNLCHELSLHYECPGGLIKKKEIELAIRFREEARISCERRDGKLIPENELQEIEYNIADLAVRNSEVKFIQKVLSLLAPRRVHAYDDWKSVLIILARENPDYKPLAIWFSQRYARSWVKGGLSALNKIWDWATSHPATEDSNMRRIGTLIEWAKQDNPEEMRKAQDQSTQATILKCALDTQGRLTDQNFADIMHLMLRRKFVCDMNSYSASAANALEWYEFVLPSDNVGLDKGTSFKYRRELSPDNLELFISRKLPGHIQNVSDWLTTKVEASADDEAKQKFFSKVKANLAKTCERLGNSVAAAGILKKCRLVFRMRGFINQLDRDPNVIGVGNGVLKLYPTTELIQRYHDNPVSRFTPVDYNSYDSSNPYVKELEQAIRELFADEEDAFYYT